MNKKKSVFAWKQINVTDKNRNVIVKSSFQDDKYIFILSDYKNIWLENLTTGDLTSRFEDLNPGIEIEVAELPKTIDEAIESKNKKTEFSLESSRDCSSAKFNIAFEIYGLKISLFFHCTRQEPESVYQHLMEPLLKSLSFLLYEKKELLKIVSEKDATIAKYRKVENNSLSTKRKPESPQFELKELETDLCNSKEFEEIVEGGYKNIFEESFQLLWRSLDDKFKTDNTTETKEIENPNANDDTQETIEDGERGNNKVESNGKKRVSGGIEDGDSEKEAEAERREMLERKLAGQAKKQVKKKVIRF